LVANEVRAAAERSVAAAGLEEGEALDLAVGLARFRLAPRRGFVAITFGDGKMIPHMLNWVHHVREARIPHIVGALDEAMLELLERSNVPNYPFFHKDLDGSNQHISDSWKKFAIGRLGQTRALLKLGYDALMTDIDVVWLNNPRPYLYCTGEPLVADVDCSSMGYADVAVSSDNLAPGLDRTGGASYPIYGTLNTGIVFLRATQAGIGFADHWYQNLVQAPGRYATLTSDQQVFNMMMREPGKWPGVQLYDPKNQQSRLVLANEPVLPENKRVKVGLLPLALFANGHAFFVQRHDVRSRVAPLAVHATYTFDGAGAGAKQFRFRERGLWFEDQSFVDNTTKMLTWDAASLPAHARGPVGLRTHLKVVEHHLASMRGALAVARVLGRTLLLPEMPCFCDKTWGGHDNIFKTKCMYPGAQTGDYLPFMCPMDHLVSPAAWVDSGVDFRAHGFLYGHFRDRVPKSIREHPVRSLAVPGLASESDVRLAAAALSHVPVISLSDAHTAFCRFDGEDDNSAFEALISKLLKPIPWCAECHPEGCAFYIEADVLSTGRIEHTRGGTAEMFCRDFSVPKAPCLKG